jgi:hypothetical protein
MTVLHYPRRRAGANMGKFGRRCENYSQGTVHGGVGDVSVFQNRRYVANTEKR